MILAAAITGWALRTPLGHSVDGVVDQLLAGARAARPNARFAADTYACRLAATLEGAPSPHRILRRVGRFGADAAAEALAMAAVAPGPRLALFCGVGGLRAHWDEFVGALAFQRPDLADGWRRGLSRLHPYWMLRHLSNNTQAELARTLGALGDGATFGGANAGAAALEAAVACLADGAADAALVVAYDGLVEPETLVALAASGAATTGDRAALGAAYGVGANGVVPGEGAAAVVLRPVDAVDTGSGLARVEARATAGDAALRAIAPFATGVGLVDGVAAARPAADAAERALLGAHLAPDTPLIATRSALGDLGAATALVQAILLGRCLTRMTWPGIADLGAPAPGPLCPVAAPITGAISCAVGLSAAAPGLAGAVRVSRCS